MNVVFRGASTASLPRDKSVPALLRLDEAMLSEKFISKVHLTSNISVLKENIYEKFSEISELRARSTRKILKSNLGDQLAPKVRLS
jgi:hypothetical protein